MAGTRAAAAGAGAGAAAAKAAMTSMWQSLGVPRDTAEAIYEDMGYQSMSHVEEMNVYEHAASRLCKILRGKKNAEGKELNVPHRAELNIAQLLFFLKHKKRTQRTVLPQDVTLEAIQALTHQKQSEGKEESNPTVPKLDASDWSKSLEGITDWLGNFRSCEDVPLSYTLRPTLRVPESSEDPPYGENGSSYSSFDEELVARAPILTAVANASDDDDATLEQSGAFAPSFIIDSNRVYDLLLPIFNDTTALPYFKTGKQGKNGRKAFFGVWNHYLGEQMMDHYATKYENQLMKAKYLGESANSNFEQFATLHKDLHIKLDGLKRQGYPGIDERTKVRHFLQGLAHESMNVVKLSIQGNPEIRSSFDSCVNLARDFINSDVSGEKSLLHIAAVNTKSNSSLSIEDQQLARWYDLDEWRTFDGEKQKKIINLRKQVRRDGGTVQGEPANSGKKRPAKKASKAVKRQIASLKQSNKKLKKSNRKLRKVAKVAAHKESDSSSSGGDSSEEEYPSTRGQAPVKKKKKKSKVSALRTLRISEARTVGSFRYADGECNLELDSHADTTVLGKHSLLLRDYGEPIKVVGWNPEAESQTLRTVSAAVLYAHPVTGQRYILVFHQVIHHPDLEHHLVCPMQLRMHGIEINETPKYLAKNPTAETFAMKINEESIGDESLIIPFHLHGVTAYFPVRKPSRAEYEDESIPKIDMTDEDIPWDPNSEHFAESESAMTDFRGQIIERETSSRGRDCIVSAVQSNIRVDEEASTSDFSFLSALKSQVCVKAVETAKAPSSINPMDLVKRWKISPKSARKTVKNTTCRMIRNILHPSLSRRFRTNDRALRYNRLRHDVYGDTLIAKVPSWKRGNKYAQVFATRFGWARAYPMRSKGDAHEAVSLLFQQCGVPPVMITDCSKEQQVSSKFRRKCQEAQCRLKGLEPYTPQSNAAEKAIGESKKGTRRMLMASRAPKKLWDHAIELHCLLMSHTSNDIFILNGEVPETFMTGETADISQISEYEFYQWVMFRDTTAPFPEDDKILGRWLGPSIDIGPAMSAKILKSNGEIVHRSTFRELTQEELESEEGKVARRLFDEQIALKLGQPSTEEDFEDVPDTETPRFNLYEDDDAKQQPSAPSDEEKPYVLLGLEGTIDSIPTPEEGDEFVNATILLPRASGQSRGRVIGRKRDDEGNPIGRRSEKGHFADDDRVYLVEFADGEVTELTANTIAMTMYANCDAEGNEYLLLDSIVDWRKTDEYISKDKQRCKRRDGTEYLLRTTKGVELCCKWKDESTSFQPLSLLKESHPVEVAEFAVAMGIEDEPAFNWWVKPVLKRRDRIIASVTKRQARYLKQRFKFGIEVPRSVDEAYELDKKNGNTFWADAIAKELKDIRVAFKILDQDETVPIGYQQIRCFFIFDVKMEDLRRKARLVCGGHTTVTPAAMTYSSVVSRETVRIALTLAALNGLQVKSGDIRNAYISAPCQEKIWTVLGPEWGQDRGKKAILVRAAYGLKSSGAAFRNHLADCMRFLGYKSCEADPDLWMKKELKPEYASLKEGGGKNQGEAQDSGRNKKKRSWAEGDDSHKYYYSYILCYVDDILCIHHDPLPILTRLDKYFQFKPGSIGDPEFYLGSKIKKMTLANGVECWASSSSKYVNEAVGNVEKYLKELRDPRWRLPKQAPNPFTMDCEPELDTSPELGPDLASFYMAQIGVLRWILELGRVDIATEVSLLSSHSAMPREGHLDAMLHLFAHLRQKHNSRLAFDPSYPSIDKRMFPKQDWSNMYHGAEEPIPRNAPEALGMPVDLRLYVDSDHAGEKLTRRSRTGWLIFMQNALINFLSKRQSTVETSVFGAEFCAMKSGIEALRGLRYKLRMMGVPLRGPSYIFGDNMSVIHNTQRPESTLKKKSCSVAYHFCREAVAMDECRTCHIPTAKNPADLCTKLIYGNKRRVLVSMILYDIYD